MSVESQERTQHVHNSDTVDFMQVPKLLISWWSRWESNPRPLECHSSALPTELRPHSKLRMKDEK